MSLFTCLIFQSNFFSDLFINHREELDSWRPYEDSVTYLCVEHTTAACCGACAAPWMCLLASATTSCRIIYKDPGAKAKETPLTV